MTPTICTSLSDAWNLMNPPPVGILDQLNVPNEPPIKLTASIYLPQQSRLVVGRQDGSIIIVPATQTVMLQLLHAQRLDSSGKIWFFFQLSGPLFIDFTFVCFRMATASGFVWTSGKSQLLIVSIIGTSQVTTEWNWWLYHLKNTISHPHPLHLDMTNHICSLVALILPFVFGICTAVLCCIASAFMLEKLPSYSSHRIHAA